ncbi:toxic anion resistance protein [Lacticaseibacillus zhaodongensis]|uniref:toxic anion resistance protein n=1 Tax=Lacticaseibacillus zhaodongensis TaxID=2668065 RepID=UPI0012D2B3B2|nr:toxic anion resistance protein [Lacticaseibacillus zhaodongensis]
MSDKTDKTDAQSNLTSDLLNDPFGQMNTPQLQPDKEMAAANMDDPTAGMTDADKEAAHALADKIDPNDQTAVLSYGANAQQKLSSFSQNMLTKVSSSDTGAIGDSLTSLMTRLNETNPDELRPENSNVFSRMFGKVKRSIFEITAKYQKIGAQIDTIAAHLDKEKNGLMSDNQLLEELYGQNKSYFEALNIYIAAAKMKQEELTAKLIPEAQHKAETSGDQMDVQTVNDLQQFVARLEKRTYDLQLAREITLQQAPQIRLIQNTNQALAEKIQASINTAIPLWKNQVAIALTLLRQKQAVTAQREVSETTNDLLKKNSQMLKISSIETAKENERGVVDIETLTQTQSDLIDTLKETLQIQQDGRSKRQAAEKQLAAMEDDLKNNLLDYTSGNMQQRDPQTHRKETF